LGHPGRVMNLSILLQKIKFKAQKKITVFFFFQRNSMSSMDTQKLTGGKKMDSQKLTNNGKKSSKRNQNPSKYCNSVTNLKFKHKPKYHLSKILI
jgi:hypothetical protein